MSQICWGRPTLLFLILLFSMGKGSRRVKLNILLRFVHTLRMSGTIPLLLPVTSRCTQKQIRTLLLGLPSCLFPPVFSIKLFYGFYFPMCFLHTPLVSSSRYDHWQNLVISLRRVSSKCKTA